MKASLSILFLLVFLLPSFSQYNQAMAIAETMANTFNIQGDKLSGTSFMITKDKNQFFVTAAHLFNVNHKSGDLVPIQLLIQNQLQSFNATIYFHKDRKVDIAVVKIPGKVSQNIQLPEEYLRYNESFQKVFQGNGISLDTTFLAFGSELFFYGFPLGNMGTEVLGIKFPLVKKSNYVRVGEVQWR